MGRTSAAALVKGRIGVAAVDHSLRSSESCGLVGVKSCELVVGRVSCVAASLVLS